MGLDREGRQRSELVELLERPIFGLSSKYDPRTHQVLVVDNVRAKAQTFSDREIQSAVTDVAVLDESRLVAGGESSRRVRRRNDEDLAMALIDPTKPVGRPFGGRSECLTPLLIGLDALRTALDYAIETEDVSLSSKILNSMENLSALIDDVASTPST